MMIPGIDIFIPGFGMELAQFCGHWLKIFRPNDSTKTLSQMVLSQVTGNRRRPFGDKKIEKVAQSRKKLEMGTFLCFPGRPFVSFFCFAQDSEISSVLNLPKLLNK